MFLPQNRIEFVETDIIVTIHSSTETKETVSVSIYYSIVIKCLRFLQKQYQLKQIMFNLLQKQIDLFRKQFVLKGLMFVLP